MNIKLNGEPYTVSDGDSLSDLAKALDLVGKRYAIEVNEDIIPRSEHDAYVIQHNDTIEVVQAIGGG